MSNATSETSELMLATFNLTKEQVAWVGEEAKRLAKSRPGSKPNRSEVARVAFEKAMRESEIVSLQSKAS